jgi:hypothetical protein
MIRDCQQVEAAHYCELIPDETSPGIIKRKVGRQIELFNGIHGAGIPDA